MTNTTRKSSAKKWTLIVLIIFVLVAVIGGTYSRYVSTGSGTGTAEVAKWAIKINDVDITPAAASTFTITFNEVDNDDVVDGKIAPASELYADFVVDPTDSEVAVDYEFELGNVTPEITDLEVDRVVASVGTTYDENGTAATLTEDGRKYSGTIELADQDTALTSAEAVTVRVYLKWSNTETNNATHTATGVTAPEISMTVTGTAKQHITE